MASVSLMRLLVLSPLLLACSCTAKVPESLQEYIAQWEHNYQTYRNSKQPPLYSQFDQIDRLVESSTKWKRDLGQASLVRPASLAILVAIGAWML
uniref:ARAD1C24882p n=1 Tax=Blastobotrys adeninivorans TaxID=409370 RepID=A0A060T2F6_BLAAD